VDAVDSAEATILIDFMTGGRLSVRGNVGKPRAGFLGVKMFCGLAVDYPLVVSGPQDLVLGYAYIESCSHYIMLQGATPSEATPSEATPSEATPSGVTVVDNTTTSIPLIDRPGNIAIRGVKIHAYVVHDPPSRNTSS
jgi:hypothetical protein